LADTSSQGFGLTIGSDLYLLVNPKAQRALEAINHPTAEFLHGNFTEYNGTTLYQFAGTFGFENATNSQHVQKG